LREFELHIAAVQIVPSRGGAFEVELDGEVIFSKKTLARHANAGEIVEAVRARLGAADQAAAGT
jgi:selT/selW/selH-like putative selenoprotein